MFPVGKNKADTGDAGYGGAEAAAVTLGMNVFCLSLSDQVLNPLVVAAHQDGRFQLNISGSELTVSTSAGHMPSKTTHTNHMCLAF